MNDSMEGRLEKRICSFSVKRLIIVVDKLISGPVRQIHSADDALQHSPIASTS